MRLAQLGAVAALAGVGHSFLIPSTIADATNKDTYTLPFDVKALTSERVVEVNCVGCPVKALDKGAMNWLHMESMLRLNFTIVREDTEDDKLMLNGVQIYPIDPSIDRLMTSLKADQFLKSPDNTWKYSSSPTLGYGLSLRHPFNPATETKNGMSLVSFRVEIIEVHNRFIRGIPGVNLFIVETPNRQLMLGPAEIDLRPAVASKPGPVLTTTAGSVFIPECKTLLCKWKAIIAAKTAGLKKGCSGKPRIHGMPRPYGIKGGPNKFTHHRPHGSFSHGHHRRPHHGPVARFFKSVTFHIIFPIVIGVFIGITASLVGMVVGHIAIFFWRLFFRRGERGQYCRVQQEAASDDNDDETKGFLDNQGPPPVYEDNVVVEEKTEQK